MYTKARKIKNNLSKTKIVKKIKKAAKKAVLATKKAVKKTKSAAKKAVTKTKQYVKASIKDTKKLMTKVGGKAAAAYTSFKSGGYKEVISTALDFIPIVGNAKALVEAAIGKDFITGRKLEAWERGVAVAAILGGPVVKGIKHGAKLGIKTVSEASSGIKKLKKGNQVDAKKSTPSTTQSNQSNTNITDFNPKTATTLQKGNFGEIKSYDNLLNNQSIKAAGYDLKPIGRPVPSSINDKIVKGIDGLYENMNHQSPIKYVIDEAKFGSSRLSKTPIDGPQMSNDWLTGTKSGKNRIWDAVGGDQKLADKIIDTLDEGQVERVLSKVDSMGNVKTFRLNAKGEIIGEWP